MTYWFYKSQPDFRFWRRTDRINPAWWSMVEQAKRKHLQIPEFAISKKCRNFWTRHTTEVKIGAFDCLGHGLLKEPNLTSVVCVVQILEQFSLKNRPRTGFKVGLRQLQLREIGSCYNDILLDSYSRMSRLTFYINKYFCSIYRLARKCVQK